MGTRVDKLEACVSAVREKPGRRAPDTHFPSA